MVAVEKLYNTLKVYYDAVAKTGYIPYNTVFKFLVLDFVDAVTSDPDYLLLATCEQQKIIDKLCECATKNNCLI